MINLSYEIFKIIVVSSVVMILLKLLHVNIKELKFRLLNMNTWFFTAVIIFITFAIPYLMNITLSGYVNKPGTNGGDWLGFWGSFLGGIIGTLGVIYVAHLQNEELKKWNVQQLQHQEDLFNSQKEYEKKHVRISIYSEKQELIIRNLMDLKNNLVVINEKIQLNQDDLVNVMEDLSKSLFNSINNSYSLIPYLEKPLDKEVMELKNKTFTLIKSYGLINTTTKQNIELMNVILMFKNDFGDRLSKIENNFGDEDIDYILEEMTLQKSLYCTDIDEFKKEIDKIIDMITILTLDIGKLIRSNIKDL